MKAPTTAKEFYDLFERKMKTAIPVEAFDHLVPTIKNIIKTRKALTAIEDPKARKVALRALASFLGNYSDDTIRLAMNVK